MPVTRDRMKIALNDLQTFVLSWVDDNQDVEEFLPICDRLHEVDQDVETARWEL